MPRFSVLDLSPIVQGGDARQALHNTLDLARHVERLGYHRYWVAEHHGMPGVASAATAVVIGYIAGGTERIRVGAGGIMLPNHAPLLIAEQFGTLESLYPGRIDLGLGRAPGSDAITQRALRRDVMAGDRFVDDVVELMAWFAPPEPGQRVRAVPGAGLHVPLWILGSSLFGAELAASLGLPFAFASHFAPQQMSEAISRYRTGFRPSEQLDRPYVMLGANIIAADSDGEARLLATSLKQAFLNLRRGMPSQMQPPDASLDERLTAGERGMLEQTLACTFVGAPASVREQVAQFLARTGADELMISSPIFDHSARLRSFELAATVRDDLASQLSR
jgi:luciferase family oxidoreductase group 1